MTSLQWLNSSVYDVKHANGDPSIWEHEVIIIEPKNNKHRNTVMLYATGGCNGEHALHPNEPVKDSEVIALDIGAFEAQMTTVVMRQLPNCRMKFKDDPKQMERVEDELLSYSMNMYLSLIHI